MDHWIRKRDDIGRHLTLSRHPKRRFPSEKKRGEFEDLLRLLESAVPRRGAKFPIGIEFCEPPDFILHWAGRTIGIEVTGAQDQNFRQVEAYAKKRYNSWTIDRGAFRPGQKGKRRVGINIALSSPPYFGGALEVDWAAYVQAAISKKAPKVRNGGFAQVDERWLLVTDKTELLPAVEAGMAALRSNLSGQNVPYDRVYLLVGHRTRLISQGASATALPMEFDHAR
jgi:hypothetical protein